jgi:hypothetical protein
MHPGATSYLAAKAGVICRRVTALARALAKHRCVGLQSALSSSAPAHVQGPVWTITVSDTVSITVSTASSLRSHTVAGAEAKGSHAATQLAHHSAGPARMCAGCRRLAAHTPPSATTGMHDAPDPTGCCRWIRRACTADRPALSRSHRLISMHLTCCTGVSGQHRAPQTQHSLTAGQDASK